MTKATIITGDALRNIGAWESVFTSLPDAAEIGGSIADWEEWFRNAAQCTIAAVDPTGYAIFYQTDRKAGGGIASKAGLIMEAARSVGARVLWHKIAVATYGTSLFRPGYSHLICVSVKGTSGRATPDVFNKGPKIYPNATDVAALSVGVDFLRGNGIGTLADPFCGRGSIGYWAAMSHMDSVNIDIDPAQTKAAESLISTVATVDTYASGAHT
jgi:hypothetical protein